MSEEGIGSAFRPVPFTGVIYVMAEAAKHGYRPNNADGVTWARGSRRLGRCRVPRAGYGRSDRSGDQDYAPVPGISELRAAVAELYNRLYRRGIKSQYTEKNVCISGGGRPGSPARSRRWGRSTSAISCPTTPPTKSCWTFSSSSPRSRFCSMAVAATAFRSTICGGRSRAWPVGGAAVESVQSYWPVIQGNELKGWVMSRELQCTLLIDEFYSHYIWAADAGTGGPSRVAARYVEDVDRDPVILFDGLTKNWRYPGWRVTWIVGPSGDRCSLQHRVIPRWWREEADAALRRVAAGRARRAPKPRRSSRLPRKRDACSGPGGPGFRPPIAPPEGTFYCWGDVGACRPH